MKFSYKFSNLLGTVYQKGNLVFSPDGNSIYSPVGNRIRIFDLKRNTSQTLEVNNKFNYTSLDISPNGLLLAVVNEQGEIYVISLISKTVIHKYRSNGKIHAIKFSPNGNYLAVLKENKVFVFQIPGIYLGKFNAFEIVKIFHHAMEDAVCVDWSSNSKFLVVGSDDMSVRIHNLGVNHIKKTYCLGGYRENIVAVFFEKDSLDVTSVSRDGYVCVWECNKELDNEEFQSASLKKIGRYESDNEDNEDNVHNEDNESNLEFEADTKESYLRLSMNGKEEDEVESDGNDDEEKFFYKKISYQNLCSSLKKNYPQVKVTSAAYHKSTRLLVSGFSTGEFFLHELPGIILIHSLSVCEFEISSITLNSSGDWIALGSSKMGHLLVWEWQSETYIMKQQGHANSIACLSYSPDGKFIVTGGFDGKVKLWNTTTGFCFVTFTEHSNNVTAVQFSPNGKFVASSSSDGTVRVFDLIRYRNFKTFTSPVPVQFACLAIDSNSEFVAAGGQDVFEIYLWSLRIGRLCEVLSGHEGPIAGIAFSPMPGSTILASVSWDKTLRLWNSVDVNQENEVFLLGSDGLSLSFRSDGEEIAVTTLNGQISFFDVKNRSQKHSIEGKNDLGYGVIEADLTSAKNSSLRAFTCVSYTPDGSSILAGGHSKMVCIYDAQNSMLLKKFEITQNRSLDNVDEFINRRKMTEFGNLDLIEDRGNGDVKIRLPGVLQENLSSRSLKLAIRVFGLEFSPSGRSWAAATTEGLLLFSEDLTLLFDPFELTLGITTETLKNALQEGDYAKALMMGIKMGEKHLIQEVIESVPCSDIELCLGSIAPAYMPHCLKFISLLLENSAHLEFYLKWIRTILTVFGFEAGEAKDYVPVLLNLQKSLHKHFEEVGKLCESNKYAIEFLSHIGKCKSKSNFTSFMEVDGDNELLMGN